MESAKLRKRRGGMVLLFMVLIIVVIGALLWFDPFALSGSSDPEMPWNQVNRIVKAGEEVPAPSSEQASITRGLVFEAEAKQEGARRGLNMWIRGVWLVTRERKSEILISKS